MENDQNSLLTAYGWSKYWEDVMSACTALNKEVEPARVVAQFFNQYRLVTRTGVVGKYKRAGDSDMEYS